VYAAGLAPTWNATCAWSVSTGEVKVNSSRWLSPVSVTSWAKYEVNGSTPSCTAARTVAPGAAEASKAKVYAEPATRGTPFCPTPASHGLARPPGTSEQSLPSVTAVEVVPYEYQPEVPSSKSPFSICSGAPPLPLVSLVSDTSSRQNVKGSAEPPSWNVKTPLAESRLPSKSYVKVCGVAVTATSRDRTVV
jgi:hypothetical protein